MPLPTLFPTMAVPMIHPLAPLAALAALPLVALMALVALVALLALFLVSTILIFILTRLDILSSPLEKDVRLLKDDILIQDVTVNAIRLRLQAIFNTHFPNGHIRIQNNGGGQMLCGLHALVDSIREQLNGVIAAPTVNLLHNIAMTKAANGDWNAVLAGLGPEALQGNFSLDMLAGVLIDWGNMVGLNLTLAAIVPADLPLGVGGPIDGPRVVFVYNNNQGSDSAIGHYEGLRPR